MRTGRKISVRNCPNESRLQYYTALSNPKAVMEQKYKAVLEGRGFYPKFSMSDSYKIRSTKIGNSAGFRLPAEFYREHPQFANASGWIEVLSPDTAIVKIIPESVDDEDEEDSLVMRLFLDFATAETLKNNTLQSYTTEMSKAAHKLIEGVELEDESLEDG